MFSNYRRQLFIMLILVASLGICAEAQSRKAVNEQQAPCAKYDQLKVEMERVYEQVLREYKDDAQFIERLKAAQEIWENYRVAHLFELYPDTSSLAYGSINQMCQCSVASDFTRERIKLLRQWLNGADNSDACAGSIKLKSTSGNNSHRQGRLNGRIARDSSATQRSR